MRQIVYTESGGITVIVSPVINTIGEAVDFTEADAEDRAMAKLPHSEFLVDPVFVEVETIPKDRTFRDAWKFDGRNFSVDMVKAREIHKDKLRKLRAPLMEELDTEYLRADEGENPGVEKRIVIDKKQVLRDVTKDPAIEAASTPEALKLLIPAGLT